MTKARVKETQKNSHKKGKTLKSASVITIKKSQANKMFSKSNEANVSFSNVKHRHCSGVDNWKTFLESKGMTLKAYNNNPLKSSKNHNPKKITKVVGMDCEMVGIGEDGDKSMLARVSIVNSFGDCIYDKFVKPREQVIDYRTAVSGVRPEDLKNAEEFAVVQEEVAGILNKRILVGHALRNDLSVLFLKHPRSAIRDTSKFFCKEKKRTPSLKSLASEYLQTTIQEGEHSSVQDAQAAMQLYNMYRRHWEAGRGNKSKRTIKTCVLEKAVEDKEQEI